MTSNIISTSTAALLRTEVEGAVTVAATEAVPHSDELATATAATCHAERRYLMMNQSLPTLIALCRGITDHEGNKLLDVDAEPWYSVRPARSIKPMSKDYIREVEFRWKTFFRPPQSSKVGPRPASWTHAQLVDWLDKHPIADVVEVAYLTSKVQEVRAAVIESNQPRAGEASFNDADEVPVIELDLGANNHDARNAQAPSRSPARAIGLGGGNGTIQSQSASNATTRTDNFAGLSESIKWLGKSVLASAELYATQKEKDRAMTIAENAKDRKAQLELVKLEAEKREKETADARARERINVLRSEIDSLRKDKRQLTMEVLSDNNKRSKTFEDFLTVELRQMTMEMKQKEVELNNLLH